MLNIAKNLSLLFITETWLLSPNKYPIPTWKQFHTYGIPVNSYNQHRGQLGLALLVNPDFKLPIHHINHVNPLLAKFTLSIIINSKLLIHCLYLPPLFKIRSNIRNSLTITYGLPFHNQDYYMW